jgi:hypothetical protein
VQQKKNFKDFPMFLHLNFFEIALKVDLRQWSSRHRRYRHRYRRRYRRNESKDERKMDEVKGSH